MNSIFFTLYTAAVNEFFGTTFVQTKNADPDCQFLLASDVESSFDDEEDIKNFFLQRKNDLIGMVLAYNHFTGEPVFEIGSESAQTEAVMLTIEKTRRRIDKIREEMGPEEFEANLDKWLDASVKEIERGIEARRSPEEGGYQEMPEKELPHEI